MNLKELNTWCEIEENALSNNVSTLRSILSGRALLGVVVKSNAYGHDIKIWAKAFEKFRTAFFHHET